MKNEEKLVTREIYKKRGNTYKVITDKFVAYGFETVDGVWVDDVEGEEYYFIISKNKDGNTFVNVGYSEDYSYMEDVTHSFDVEDFWELFESMKEDIPDHTNYYWDWVENK